MATELHKHLSADVLNKVLMRVDPSLHFPALHISFQLRTGLGYAFPSPVQVYSRILFANFIHSGILLCSTVVCQSGAPLFEMVIRIDITLHNECCMA